MYPICGQCIIFLSTASCGCDTTIIIIAGWSGANFLLNGKYKKQSYNVNSKPCYKSDNAGAYVYWAADKKAWTLASTTVATTGYARNYDDTAYPYQATRGWDNSAMSSSCSCRM